MSSEASRAHPVDKSALSDAYRALALLDVRIQRSYFGDVEGVDTVDLALDALAYPLARLFSFPLDPTEAPNLVDVFAYLSSRKFIEPEVVDRLKKVLQGIRRSTYVGLRNEDIERMEVARRALYSDLEALLSEVEKEAPDG